MFVLKMVVKVPSGMIEADLARPVIEIRDLVSQKLMFEIYSYGEETVVIPVTKESGKTPMKALAEKQVLSEFGRYSKSAEVEVLGEHKVRVYVPKRDKAKIIGTKGVNITAIEKKLGIKIDVAALEDTSRKELKRIGYQASERGTSLIFNIGAAGKMVDLFIEDEFLFTSTSSKKGEVKVNKKSELGAKLLSAMDSGKKIYIKG